MTNKQALREAAEKAGAEVWCAFIDTKSKTYAVHTPDDDRCGDVVKWPGLDGQQRAAAKARFIAAANPATVLALLDELEAAESLAKQQGNIAVALFDEVTTLRRNADDKAPELRSQLEDAEKRIADQCGIIASARKFISEYAGLGDVGAAEFIKIIDRAAAAGKGEAS